MFWHQITKYTTNNYAYIRVTKYEYSTADSTNYNTYPPLARRHRAALGTNPDIDPLSRIPSRYYFAPRCNSYVCIYEVSARKWTPNGAECGVHGMSEYLCDPCCPRTVRQCHHIRYRHQSALLRRPLPRPCLKPSRARSPVWIAQELIAHSVFVLLGTYICSRRPQRSGWLALWSCAVPQGRSNM